MFNKLKNDKKGFLWLIPMLLNPMGLIFLGILLIAILGFGFGIFFALKAILPWLVFTALIGLGIYLMVQGNPSWGVSMIILGLAVMFLSSQGMIELSWMGGAKNPIVSDIGITPDNKVEISVLSLQEYRGAVGLVATYIDGQFVRADYIWVKNTHSKTPYVDAFSRAYNQSFDLEQYVTEYGSHNVELKYDIRSINFANMDEYTVNEYWTQCNPPYVSIFSTKVNLDTTAKSFYRAYLPCSEFVTYASDTGKKPLNIAKSFTYTNLPQEDLARFDALPKSKKYSFIVVDKSQPVIEVNTSDGSGQETSVGPVEQKSSLWESIKSWFAGISWSI